MEKINVLSGLMKREKVMKKRRYFNLKRTQVNDNLKWQKKEYFVLIKYYMFVG
jgi:hypothetical protein